MTIEGFDEFLRVRPFEPIAVHIADGRILYVRHPDGASFSAGGRTISLMNESRQMEIVDVLLVTSLRPFNPVESATAR